MKTICLDFDGVLHSYTSRWVVPELIPDPPVPGAVAFVQQLVANGWKVYVQSVRSGSEAGYNAICDWLGENGFPEHPLIEVVAEKPRAWVYLDDRAMLFTGAFPTLTELENFTPWNRPAPLVNTMPTLFATVGLPRSGKSTWARSQSCPIVNPDAIRIALHGQRFAAPAEPFVWAIAKVMVKALFEAGHASVILDATNTTEARRKEWISKSWQTHWRVFDTPKDICIERAKLSGMPDLIPVIEKMAAEFELPPVTP